MNGQEACKKMFNISNHERNAKQNCKIMKSISIFLKTLRFSGCLLLYHYFDNTKVMVNNLQLGKAGFASKIVRLVTYIGN